MVVPARGNKRGLRQPGLSGGPGGNVELTLDPAFPELAQLIKVDVSGGEGGHAGRGGSAGSAGSGGGGIGQGSQSGQRGAGGTGGTEGSPGQRGPDGRAQVTTGAVESRFADVAQLTVLSSRGASSAVAEKATPGTKGGGASKKGKLDDKANKKGGAKEKQAH